MRGESKGKRKRRRRREGEEVSMGNREEGKKADEEEGKGLRARPLEDGEVSFIAKCLRVLHSEEKTAFLEPHRAIFSRLFSCFLSSFLPFVLNFSKYIDLRVQKRKKKRGKQSEGKEPNKKMHNR